MSCVHWMMIMPARFPATTPIIWVATRMAGTNVWAMSAARGPNFLTTQPATKRFSVPVAVRTYVGLVDRTIATTATTAKRTAERRAHAENAKLRSRAGSNLISAAAITGAVVRRVRVVKGVALHEMEDVEEPGRGSQSAIRPSCIRRRDSLRTEPACS